MPEARPFVETAYPETAEELLDTVDAMLRGEVVEIASTWKLIQDICKRLLELERRQPPAGEGTITAGSVGGCS